MEPDHTAHDAAMARLDAFIGEWVMEGGFLAATAAPAVRRSSGRWTGSS